MLILLIEDDPVDAAILKRELSKANGTAEVQHLADGEVAVQYLCGRGKYADRRLFPLPELILLDLKLPKVDGFQVLEAIGGREELARLPVVVLSSSKHPPDVNRAYDLGANSYIVKPSSAAEVADMAQSLTRYWLRHNKAPVPVTGEQ